MWIVAKYKTRELGFLKENFNKVLGEVPTFYIPKIQYQKYFRKKLQTLEKHILENYLLCYHPKFKDTNPINELKSTKGLKYFLSGCYESQKEIIGFVDHCKFYEGADGYLTSGFFDISGSTKAKFISGPFTDMVFTIITIFIFF